MRGKKIGPESRAKKDIIGLGKTKIWQRGGCPFLSLKKKKRKRGD